MVSVSTHQSSQGYRAKLKQTMSWKFDLCHPWEYLCCSLLMGTHQSSQGHRVKLKQIMSWKFDLCSLRYVGGTPPLVDGSFSSIWGCNNHTMSICICSIYITWWVVVWYRLEDKRCSAIISNADRSWATMNITKHWPLLGRLHGYFPPCINYCRRFIGKPLMIHNHFLNWW